MRNYFVAAVFAVVFLALFRFDFGLIPEGDYRFRVAAEDGDAFAQAQLGQHYLARAISREDLEWAIYWLERAASQGEGQAIYMLGVMRAEGMYYRKNMAAALPFFIQAAKQDNGPAQEHLAQLFATGAFGRPNYMESYKWFLLAARHGKGLGENDYDAGRHLTARQKAEALRAANALSARFRPHEEGGAPVR